jgi:hypothetical protein
LWGGEGNLRKHRHDLVRDALFDLSRVAGFSPIKDGPVQCLGESNNGIHLFRPADLLIRGDDFGHSCVDVTVVSPFSQPFPRGYVFGKAAAVAELNKINKHRQPCLMASYGFHPFAVDVFGSMGAESMVFIKRLASAFALASSQLYSYCLSLCYRRVSFALQLGLARQLLAGQSTLADEIADMDLTF